MSKNSNSKNLLLNRIKLKREDNYIIQKEVIKDIIIINGLRHYIYKKGKVPQYIGKFNKKVDEIKLVVQLIQEAKDLSIKIIIKFNIKSTPIQMLVECKLVYKIQVTLQTQYKGIRAVFNYNIIKSYIKIKYNNYFNFTHFIIIIL